MSYFSNCYRRPHTTQERRANQGCSDLWRTRRNKANLVEAWDDQPRSNQRQRSWKDYRKTQYKGW